MDLVDRRVLVTGGSGFLGQAVVRHLQARGAVVSAPRSRDFDLRRREAINALLGQASPEVIVHLAAIVGGIGANQANPGRFFYENAIMGLQLIEAARQLPGLLKFIAVGTICAYPKWTPVPFREEALWDGYPEETNAPYGLAKKMMLVQCQAYRQQYGFPGIYLLPVNLYGPADNFDLESSHVIPAMIRKFTEAAASHAPEVTLWGSGNASREFLFVEDCAEGITLAAERYDGADPINLGSGREISIRDLAALIAGQAGFTGRIRWDTARPDGQPRRCLDTGRAAECLGFRARTSLEDGVARTVSWWLAHRHERIPSA